MSYVIGVLVFGLFVVLFCSCLKLRSEVNELQDDILSKFKIIEEELSDLRFKTKISAQYGDNSYSINNAFNYKTVELKDVVKRILKHLNLEPYIQTKEESIILKKIK